MFVSVQCVCVLMFFLILFCILVAMHTSPCEKPQARYFYPQGGIWTSFCEGQLVDELASQPKLTGFPINEDSPALEVARHKLNMIVNCFKRDDVMKRYLMLKKRHEEFSTIISMSGVRYDPVENVIHAERPAWKFILKV